MKLSVNQIENANLAFIHDVFVMEGELKDPGVTHFYKLIVAPRPDAIKHSRIDDITLKIVLDSVGDDELELVRQALLKNPSLSESHDAIREGTWYKSTATISPT